MSYRLTYRVYKTGTKDSPWDAEGGSCWKLDSLLPAVVEQPDDTVTPRSTKEEKTSRNVGGHISAVSPQRSAAVACPPPGPSTTVATTLRTAAARLRSGSLPAVSRPWGPSQSPPGLPIFARLRFPRRRWRKLPRYRSSRLPLTTDRETESCYLLLTVSYSSTPSVLKSFMCCSETSDHTEECWESIDRFIRFLTNNSFFFFYTY